ncbi:ferritin-like domain-containing protein [Aestuariivirga sp.]|uniref:YciE/YciF ferroxidase family protein n=1 Tax=Aestuariivirga sp. TaxID=2650926 RepID=UPI0039E6CDF9
MPAKEKTLKTLFHDTLKDVYFAEKKILATLPKMAKAATDDQLKTAFEEHHAQTEQHVARLEEVFSIIGAKPQAKTCDAIMGIVKEGAGLIEEYKGNPALDAALLAVAQAVEHYEISRYGTLKCWAEELGINDAVSVLDETLQEEKHTNDNLTKLAVSIVNIEAQAA